MKKLLLISLLLLGIQFIGKSQSVNIDTLENVPYVCQADSFTVSVSGILPSPSCKFDSVKHIFRNDSLLITLYYKCPPGFGVLNPFKLPLRFGTPQPAYYTIHSERYLDGIASAEGTSHIGICTTVSGFHEKTRNLKSIKVHPNPTQNFLNIEFSEKPQALTAELSDLTGKVLLKQTFKTSEAKQLSLENLKPGIYLLLLETEKGKTVRKVVKN